MNAQATGSHERPGPRGREKAGFRCEIRKNTQNRDTEALQIKIDELIRANRGAENTLLDLESLPQNSLDEFRDHYRKLAEHARAQGFDLVAIIAGMEAEKKLLRQERRSVKAGTIKRENASYLWLLKEPDRRKDVVYATAMQFKEFRHEKIRHPCNPARGFDGERCCLCPDYP